jgi:hypothetical protein
MMAFRAGQVVGRWGSGALRLIVRHTSRLVVAGAVTVVALAPKSCDVKKPAQCLIETPLQSGWVDAVAVMSWDGKTVSRYEWIDRNNLRQTVDPTNSQHFECQLD